MMEPGSWNWTTGRKEERFDACQAPPVDAATTELNKSSGSLALRSKLSILIPAGFVQIEPSASLVRMTDEALLRFWTGRRHGGAGIERYAPWP